LHLSFKVNQEITARNQIQARERRIGQKIVRSKYDKVPDVFSNPISAIFFLKKPFQALRTHIGCDIAGIETFASFFQGAAVQVGSEYLDGRRRLLLCSLFYK